MPKILHSLKLKKKKKVRENFYERKTLNTQTEILGINESIEKAALQTPCNSY